MTRYEHPSESHRRGVNYFHPEVMRRRKVLNEINNTVTVPLILMSKGVIGSYLQGDCSGEELQALESLIGQLEQSVGAEQLGELTPDKPDLAVIEVDPVVADEVIDTLIFKRYGVPVALKELGLERQILPTRTHYVAIEDIHKAGEERVTRLLVRAG